MHRSRLHPHIAYRLLKQLHSGSLCWSEGAFSAHNWVPAGRFNLAWTLLNSALTVAHQIPPLKALVLAPGPLVPSSDPLDTLMNFVMTKAVLVRSRHKAQQVWEKTPQSSSLCIEYLGRFGSSFCSDLDHIQMLVIVCQCDKIISEPGHLLFNHPSPSGAAADGCLALLKARGLYDPLEVNLESPSAHPIEEVAFFIVILGKLTELLELPVPVENTKTNWLTEILRPAFSMVRPLLPFNEALMDPILVA
ncbi:hypothetical protein NDU88_002345 [Pleurodeles waltl]|uniref:Uncharacterized protein n=1 Tax=Pleurodeles waltl TaxID=8319 RepID=A0AAV7MAQ6_PLEWA|nr:hypothetical protein NDU88_002345 [Pleurodeles waltl]